MPVFVDLPVEIRLEIFELAASWQCRPRIVEIVEKNGVVYSASPPPALLHVNTEARDVVMKIYKPWASSLKGTATVKHLEDSMRKLGAAKAWRITRLQNVYIHPKDDILMMDDWIWNLGIGETSVHQLCVRISHKDLESEGSNRTAFYLKRFKRLAFVYIYDPEFEQAGEWWRYWIHDALGREREKEHDKAAKKTKTPYYSCRLQRVMPWSESMQHEHTQQREIDKRFNKGNWVKYRYPSSPENHDYPYPRITRSMKRKANAFQDSKKKRLKGMAESMTY